MSRAPLRFVAALGSLVPVVACAACAGAHGAPASSGAAPSRDAVAAPDVELRDADGKRAFVGASAVPMDGVAEGLAWPALRSAVTRKPGDHAPLTIAVARAVPIGAVLRAVWTLRDADIRLQTPDESGTPRVLELRPKPDARGSAAEAECHLAVFVAPNGDLSVALPGGPRLLAGPDASSTFARALASERARCAIRYVAFGAQSADAPWSAVFDVARAVDRDKAAGDARYVLGEPVHVAAR